MSDIKWESTGTWCGLHKLFYDRRKMVECPKCTEEGGYEAAFEAYYDKLDKERWERERLDACKVAAFDKICEAIESLDKQFSECDYADERRQVMIFFIKNV